LKGAVADNSRPFGEFGSSPSRPKSIAAHTGSKALLPSSTAAGWRDRARVLVHLAVTVTVAIVLGATNLSEGEQLPRAVPKPNRRRLRVRDWLAGAAL
jgi:hypothetical protein